VHDVIHPPANGGTARICHSFRQRRVQCPLPAVPGTLNRSLRPIRSMIITIATQELLSREFHESLIKVALVFETFRVRSRHKRALEQIF